MVVFKKLYKGLQDKDEDMDKNFEILLQFQSIIYVGRAFNPLGVPTNSIFLHFVKYTLMSFIYAFFESVSFLSWEILILRGY